MESLDLSTDERLGVFAFSYNEHDRLENLSEEEWETFGEAEEIAALIQAAETGEWIRLSAGEKSDFSYFASEKGMAEMLADEDINSPQELLSLAMDEWESSAENALAVFQKPIAKLETLMSQEGWTFVSGIYYSFDGHHNDTTFIVLLRKAS
jgi:hypothetical protein